MEPHIEQVVHPESAVREEQKKSIEQWTRVEEDLAHSSHQDNDNRMMHHVQSCNIWH